MVFCNVLHICENSAVLGGEVDKKMGVHTGDCNDNLPYLEDYKNHWRGGRISKASECPYIYELPTPYPDPRYPNLAWKIKVNALEKRAYPGMDPLCSHCNVELTQEWPDLNSTVGGPFILRCEKCLIRTKVDDLSALRVMLDTLCPNINNPENRFSLFEGQEEDTSPNQC